jgi:transposase
MFELNSFECRFILDFAPIYNPELVPLCDPYKSVKKVDAFYWGKEVTSRHAIT